MSLGAEGAVQGGAHHQGSRGHYDTLNKTKQKILVWQSANPNPYQDDNSVHYMILNIVPPGSEGLLSRGEGHASQQG